jgi:uncharacterized membrane protein YfcA
MPALALACLVAVFGLTAFISVVTGGTSLITVPVMMQLGVEPHVAVATNMLTLVFLSLGGAVPFLEARAIPRKRLPALVGLTLVSSMLGALLLCFIPAKVVPPVVAVAMIVVAVFMVAKRNAGSERGDTAPSPVSELAGYVLTFMLGVYGGFFSGGYVALLMVALVASFGMTFLEAVAVTKVLNVTSSLVATLVFAARGLVHWRLGLTLSLVSFAGAILGASVARKLSNAVLRRIFLGTVIALAVKTLVYDF